jgi:putative SOS response-associated peptidase YedK
MPPSYNVCPTDPIDVVTEKDGERDFVRMRWGLVPFWWSKPLKELRMATFNARAESVTTKPAFREPFARSRCLIPMSGYLRMAGHGERKTALVFHRTRRISGTDGRRHLGQVAEP